MLFSPSCRQEGRSHKAFSPRSACKEPHGQCKIEWSQVCVECRGTRLLL